jgi:hypothetical protein
MEVMKCDNFNGYVASFLSIIADTQHYDIQEKDNQQNDIQLNNR